MSVTRTVCGMTADAVPVEQLTLTTRHGASVTLLAWGALVQAVRVPDRRGVQGDVVLGFDALAPYLVRHPNFGVTVGRYANRIAQARFTLDGITYPLAANNGANALHGGVHGFARKAWTVEMADATSVRFGYTSADKEEGYPGALRVAVTYSFDDEHALAIDYEAATDRATVVNLTNHSYFNLAGGGDILAHDVQIFADAFLPVDAATIPTGEVRAVHATPMDCRTVQRIGARIHGADEQLRHGNGGYDHTYVLGASGVMKHAARVVEVTTGRVLDVHTTQPGLQFYTGNNLDGTFRGKGGSTYEKHAGVCLEPQHYPDSPNQSAFPTTVLRPGERYRHRALYRFTTVS